MLSPEYGNQGCRPANGHICKDLARLEEIESSTADGRPVWLITLSSDLPKARSPLSSFSPLAVTIGADSEREYKVFAVAKDNGDVLSMKIRLLAVPTF